MNDKFRGALLGLACGDAVGTTVEFQTRGEFEPVTDMVGGGAFNLEPGQWTDDTSMALCLAQSLVDKGGMDAVDQLQKYVDWLNLGYMSSNGHCFDIGGTTRRALRDFQEIGSEVAWHDDYSLGNGSIMRLAPVPMFFHDNRTLAVFNSGLSSRTTHSAPQCIEACKLLGAIIFNALHSDYLNKEEILFCQHDSFMSKSIQDIADGTYVDKSEKEIVGSGYVIQSLEAALWCFYTTDNFRDAILKAANLGDDADTTAAICGQVAGAFYGEDGIPLEWRMKLAKLPLILELADKLPRTRLKAKTDKEFVEAVTKFRKGESSEVMKLRTALQQIQQWDMLNPPQTDVVADLGWLKRLVDEALK